MKIKRIIKTLYYPKVQKTFIIMVRNKMKQEELLIKKVFKIINFYKLINNN